MRGPGGYPLAAAALLMLAACGSEPAEPTGRIAFVSDRSGDHEIWVMNANGSGPRQLTHMPPLNWSPAWSPDGRQVVFVSTAGRNVSTDIYVVNADGSNLRQITSTPDDEDLPAFLPDGMTLVFLRGAQVFLMDADGSQQRPWGPAASLGNVSPDGREMLVTQGDIGLHYTASEVWVADIDGARQRRVADTMGHAASPSWSPDGRRIAMECARETIVIPPVSSGGLESNPIGVCVVETDGSGLRRIVDEGLEPTWSPDGKWIAFVRDDDIYVTRPDGTGIRKVTAYPGQDRAPAWSPTP